MSGLRAVPIPTTREDTSAVGASRLVYKYLTSDGSASMNTLGAPSVKTFSYSTTVDVALERVLVHLVDGSINVTDFGGISGSLTTGVQFAVTDSLGTVLLDFNDGEPIRTNGDWVALAGVDVDRDLNTGAGDDRLAVRWTIAKAGAPLYLSSGQSFTCRIGDDLTEVTKLQMMVQGVTIPSKA